MALILIAVSGCVTFQEGQPPSSALESSATWADYTYEVDYHGPERRVLIVPFNTRLYVILYDGRGKPLDSKEYWSPDADTKYVITNLFFDAQPEILIKKSIHGTGVSGTVLIALSVRPTELVETFCLDEHLAVWDWDDDRKSEQRTTGYITFPGTNQLLYTTISVLMSDGHATTNQSSMLYDLDPDKMTFRQGRPNQPSDRTR